MTLDERAAHTIANYIRIATEAVENAREQGNEERLRTAEMILTDWVACRMCTHDFGPSTNGLRAVTCIHCGIWIPAST